MGLFGRGKGDDDQPTEEPSPRRARSKGGSDAASARVGVVSSVLAAPGEGEGPSLFDQVVERRFGPDGKSPEKGGARADDAPIDVDATSVEDAAPVEHEAPDLMDDAAEPPLEIDAMAHIGTATTIVGHLSADEDLEIQGRIEGSIRVARHRLRLGREAAIEASVEARVVEVEGRVVGDVVADELVEIRSGGVVRGDVRSPRVIIDDGGILVGGLDMSAALPAGADEATADVEGDATASADDAAETPDKPKLIKVDPAVATDAARSEEGA